MVPTPTGPDEMNQTDRGPGRPQWVALVDDRDLDNPAVRSNKPRSRCARVTRGCGCQPRSRFVYRLGSGPGAGPSAAPVPEVPGVTSWVGHVRRVTR